MEGYGDSGKRFQQEADNHGSKAHHSNDSAHNRTH
jgi:hypothetical protein